LETAQTRVTDIPMRDVASAYKRVVSPSV